MTVVSPSFVPLSELKKTSDTSATDNLTQSYTVRPSPLYDPNSPYHQESLEQQSRSISRSACVYCGCSREGHYHRDCRKKQLRKFGPSRRASYSSFDDSTSRSVSKSGFVSRSATGQTGKAYNVSGCGVKKSRSRFHRSPNHVTVSDTEMKQFFLNFFAFKLFYALSLHTRQLSREAEEESSGIEILTQQDYLLRRQPLHRVLLKCYAAMMNNVGSQFHHRCLMGSSSRLIQAQHHGMLIQN